jgi:PhnB protein
MSTIKLNPYLNFNGTAEQAIQLYQSALGAKVEHLMRFGEASGMPVAPEEKNRVMHALLQLGGGVIMISDTMATMPVNAAPNGNTHVALHFDDADDMRKKFDALAVGGTVTMPIADTFWGAKFGMLTDAFGIRWMFNCETRR